MYFFLRKEKDRVTKQLQQQKKQYEDINVRLEEEMLERLKSHYEVINTQKFAINSEC